jgi:hypothetical protein
VVLKVSNFTLNLTSVTNKEKAIMVLLFIGAATVASLIKDFDVSLFGSKLRWPINDKVTHFLGAGLFGFLAVIISKKHIIVFGKSVHLLLLSLILFSITEEFSQILRPNRGFSFGDMAANLLGILVFSKLAEWALKKGLIIR